MTPPPPPQQHVLIVEDEWLIAENLACTLEDAGYRPVGPASSVAEASALIGTATIDAAVLDVNLGEERSFAVADGLSARRIPFIFLTGYSAHELPARFAGSCVMGKPVLPALLLQELARLFVTPPAISA